jgi:hypothetical protein
MAFDEINLAAAGDSVDDSNSGLLVRAAILGRCSKQSDVDARIPASDEKLPAIGLGTWQAFDVGDSPAAREPLEEVLRSFVKFGGKVIDSSPMYGRAESVIGD